MFYTTEQKYCLSAPIVIGSLERRDASIFTLVCATSGSPPTTVTWVKDGDTLVNDRMFQITQELRDGTTSLYDNVLRVDGRPDAVTGTYTCTVDNDLSSVTTQSITLSGKLPYVPSLNLWIYCVHGTRECIK